MTAPHCAPTRSFIVIPTVHPSIRFEGRIPDGEYESDDAVDGILVQLPLPGQIDAKKVIDAITAERSMMFLWMRSRRR